MTDYTDTDFLSGAEDYGGQDEGVPNEYPYDLLPLASPPEAEIPPAEVGAAPFTDNAAPAAQDFSAAGSDNALASRLLDEALPYPSFVSDATTDLLGDDPARVDADGKVEADMQPELPAAGRVGDWAVEEALPAPAPGGSGTFFQAETSADLLRWRAEQLLDEMMIGAVDASAGESTHFAAAEPAGARHYAEPAAQRPEPVAFARVEELRGMPRIPQAGPPAPATTGYPAPGIAVEQPSPVNGAAAAPRLVSVEQRYAPYVRTMAPPLRPQIAPANGTASHHADAGSNGHSANGYGTNGHSTNGHGANGHGANGHGANGHGANGHAVNGKGADAYAASGHTSNGRAQMAEAAAADELVPLIPQLGPVRRSAVVATGSVAGAMTAGSTRSKYTSLLPRSAPWDAREMGREIGQLSAVIDRHLPSGYESSRRARYLLDKAAGILADDPDRSAEVDYYLGQVRAIVQRVRQAVVWSNLYRRRLSLYLLGWVVLSGVYLAGGLLFGSELAGWLVGMAGLSPTGLVANHLVAALFAAFAGSLGASVRALAGLGRVGLQHSLVDRKFGLRGLVLPLIGFVAGLLIYAVLGAAFWIVGVPASLLDWLTLLPAALAFLFGLFQEALYGVRD